jgi:hypothetical protein
VLQLFPFAVIGSALFATLPGVILVCIQAAGVATLVGLGNSLMVAVRDAHEADVAQLEAGGSVAGLPSPGAVYQPPVPEAPDSLSRLPAVREVLTDVAQHEVDHPALGARAARALALLDEGHTAAAAEAIRQVEIDASQLPRGSHSRQVVESHRWDFDQVAAALERRQYGL